MAKSKAPVDPNSIDLQGKRKDAQLLERYALENGASALPFLEQALADGSQLVRVATTTAIAAIDAERAEHLVFALIAALGPKPKSKERKLAHELLLHVATPKAIAAFLDDGGEVKAPSPPRMHAALVAHVVAQAPRVHAEQLRALLGRSGILAEQGSTALEAFEAAGIHLGIDLALEVSRFASQKARFAALARYVGDASGRKAVAATLTSRDHQGWIGVLAPFRHEREVFLALLELRDPDALEKLRATAARDVFDAETRDACYRLGALADASSSAILLRWLEDSSAREVAPMLLTALASCGDARSVPVLERVRAQHPAGRAGFFDHAIRAIRERVGA